MGITSIGCRECLCSWKFISRVYMKVPCGFETHGGGNKICLLKKALYGLNQSPRA